MKYTWPTSEDPTPPIFHWLASGVTQILALGNAKIYQHVGLFLRYLTPSPDASSFASQWNIGFNYHGACRLHAVWRLTSKNYYWHMLIFKTFSSIL